MLSVSLMYVALGLFSLGVSLFLFTFVGFGQFAGHPHRFGLRGLTMSGQQCWRFAYELTLGGIVLALTVHLWLL